MIARLTYGALFTLLLPLALLAWAARLDDLLSLPMPPVAAAGPWVLAAGIAFMVAGTQALWRHGHGLPMSAFPPTQLVSRGVYRLVANPLYVGAVLAACGVALVRHSPAGTWIVAPLLAALATAWVMGFEAAHTRALFGESPRPALHLPDDVERAPSTWERWAVVVRVLMPWLLAFLAVEWLGVPPDARPVPRLPGELAWTVIPWTESVYLLTYVMVIATPFVLHRARDLRRFAIDGMVSTAMIIPFYVLVPLVVQAKPVPMDSFWTAPLMWERAGDLPVTAFPAFHVVWTLIAAGALAARWPRTRWLWTAVSIAVCVSCVTTGMHAVLDVVAGVAAYALVRRAAPIWRALCRGAEAVANSWREWRIGPVRVLNHGVYAAIGGVGGAAIAIMLAGAQTSAWIMASTVVAIVGAALWAQVVEGSTQLLRPYGYFGSVIGALLVSLGAMVAGHDPWLLLAAMSVGGCVTTALGRLRCLVQGCCHGRTVSASWGIHYRHPRSRVVRLSALGGLAVHPTPLYSALWAMASGLVLARLWWLAAPLPFIAGAALILAGLGRFVEEHYRGEPQTAQFAGLRLYQWLAIALVVTGGAFTCVSGRAAPSPTVLEAGLWPTLVLLFAFTMVAYGVDFPESNRRFSRLV
ncbi:MAG: prolipoprotein diacylglyceryl transferase [Gemmatimonadaceae bacterium]|nr:prolipoprotein diacylglyceryl transferase [Gemmatimonadaceae bacterium]